MEVRLTDRAFKYLFSIWDYIAESGERMADECVARITARTDQHSLFPKSGVDHLEIEPGARTVWVDRWLVIYRVRETEVQIVRTVDGARDLRKLAFPRD